MGSYFRGSGGFNPIGKMFWQAVEAFGAQERHEAFVSKKVLQPLNHQEQLLVVVIGFQHQLVLPGHLALVGLDQ